MIKILQASLRRLFMYAEAIFNKAFGDKINPLYHLGAIAFYLFWLVAATGLYLYAFFKTSVADSYASVEALTHGQWYIGGIVRSVHRYASDGMVFTMGVHMLRHFAFDRFRSFRAFSWITGVFLIWFVYVSGINGYMLPWDKLAQFAVTATFEWLDWVPIFNGVLIRNFIYQTSVSDRFFSLLTFIHLGVSLIVLMLMWVHVQRVPNAATNPPRPIRLSLIATLFVLALVKPVISQGGPADFGTEPGVLRFDWFFFLIFPLLYLWPLGRVWALLMGATGLLTALPWLPPRWRRGDKRDYQMTVRPDGRTIQLREGETILEAGLRNGIRLPFECRSGGCGKCKCTVLHGSVEQRNYQPSALTDAEKASGTALMCCATPLSDIEFEYAADEHANKQTLSVYEGRVSRMDRLAPDVMRVMISLPAGVHIDFEAGQYINILLEDGARRAFSFANGPHANDTIELHVRLVDGGRFTTQVFTQMKVGDTLRFEGPLGTFTLRDGDKPIIFVAGATGFAPVKSIVESAFQRGLRRPMLLYWGVRRPMDLYMKELAERWQQEHANFKFVPVLSDARPEDEWHGRTGLVHEAIVADTPNLSGYEVYVCGSVRMVETAFPAFLECGLTKDHCFSDAFMPSNR